MGIAMLIDDNSDDSYEYYPAVVPAVIGGGVLGIVLGILFKKQVRYEYPKPEDLEPVLKQHLTNDQIKSLAESHNRKTFKEVLGTN